MSALISAHLSFLKISNTIREQIHCLTIGHLLTRFAEKGITFRIKSNPIERSILWTMNVPEHISAVTNASLYMCLYTYIYLLFHDYMHIFYILLS